MKKFKMKKVLAVIMALAIVSCLGLTSLAAHTNINTAGTNQVLLDEDKTSTGDSIVWFQTDRDITPDKDGDITDDADVDDNYEVLVPAKILATEADADETNDYEVSVPYCLIHPDKQLEIAVTYDGEMKHNDKSSEVLTYKMQNDGADFDSDDVILTVAAGDPTPTTPESTDICAVLTMAPLFAGVYENTVTFSCDVVDAD